MKVFEVNVPAPFEGKSASVDGVEVRFEDSRMSMQIEIYPPDESEEMFVRLLSWSEEKTHQDMSSLLGKKVRVTVEIIE